MNIRLYILSGIYIRHCRRAEPARHPEPAPLVRALGRRDRAQAAAVAAVRIQAPPSTAGSRVRGITHRSAEAPVSTEAGAAHGARRLARALPALLVKAGRCAGAALGKNGQDFYERKETT